MNNCNLRRIALIGSGPSGLYLLRNLLRNSAALADVVQEVTVFEREEQLGVGMPYSPATTDRFNICNISSEEIPPLDVSFADWLRSLDRDTRASYGVEADSISPKATYPRIALGGYFRSQWIATCEKLEAAGIAVGERPSCEVVDVVDDESAEQVWMITDQGERLAFDRVVIATGHRWDDKDRPNEGFYASPWPIHKLLPRDGELLPFTVGTLGASLSAFDVVTSLAHRHGCFTKDGDEFTFTPHPEAQQFKIVMHAANGWLPHLQYEQEEPFREIYRHVSRADLLSLVDNQGWLRLDAYFDNVCRPALIEAFSRDHRTEMADRLKDPTFGFEQFTDAMTDEHEYRDAFEGMRSEMVRAKKSVTQDRPIHWKEVLDDLMYTLNFHAERLPAEDHLRFRSVVMPFLMNVIAALPLDSARTLLALRDAGRLELVAGYVKVLESAAGQTVVEVDCDGDKSIHRYRMFVDCSGEQALEVDEYPFQSLVESGSVRVARANFASGYTAEKFPEITDDDLIDSGDDSGVALRLGGVDIDESFCVIGSNGQVNPRIQEVAFPHTTGMRPYSYGLQACNDTAAIVVGSWVATCGRT